MIWNNFISFVSLLDIAVSVTLPCGMWWPKCEFYSLDYNFLSLWYYNTPVLTITSGTWRPILNLDVLRYESAFKPLYRSQEN